MFSEEINGLVVASIIDEGEGMQIKGTYDILVLMILRKTLLG